MREKRDNPRFVVNGECDLKILFKRDDPRITRTRTLKARIKNASEGGLYLETRESFQEGDLADCDFRLGGGQGSSSLGLIKWHAPGKGVGIEFFYGSEEERDSLRKDVRGALVGS